ncbi:glycosyltransferase family 4 protein [Salinisphaera sp.]|uniref:glycosyltransferase family 4 protein n=1 Tax=Salinisphaera sp. TaxID=1914330 RepID=UPI002D788517|nr:glycosyltransferase family 4 protein [Salinisphaera sp.]HET7314555.1 glycosyltransferase family 4 protein [Salinisphaera sp.]
MQIAYVVDTFPKRSETFVRDEVEWMARRGCLDRVFALKSEPEALEELSDNVRKRIRLLPEIEAPEMYSRLNRLRWLRRQPGLFRSRLMARSMSRESFEQFVLGSALARMLRAEPLPDAMHVHFAGLSAHLARYARHITGVPYTFCAHHYDIFHSAPPNFPVLTHDAARMTTISEYNRRYLIEHFKLPADKIEVIHCGIDTERFDSDTRASAQERVAGESTLNLISVGRLTAVKAQSDQIEAARLLADAGLDFKLRIIGDGEQSAALSKQIDTLGLSSHVQLLGAQASRTVRQELRRADIFVMSSLSEGIPVALMEAMATRLPVITTGVRGIPELVIDQVNGVLVPENNPRALADAIHDLAADPTRRHSMGESGRQTVIESFSADKEYRKLAQVWERNVSR